MNISNLVKVEVLSEKEDVLIFPFCLDNGQKIQIRVLEQDGMTTITDGGFVNKYLDFKNISNTKRRELLGTWTDAYGVEIIDGVLTYNNINKSLCIVAVTNMVQLIILLTI